MKKIIVDKEIGTIVLTRNNRAKRIIVRLKPDCVAVTLPYFSLYEDAMKFVKSKQDWIMGNRENSKVKRRLITNEKPLSTLTFDVKLQPAVRKDFLISLKNNILLIEYPDTVLPESENVQQVFRKAIENALRYEAKKILPLMLEKLANQYDFTFSDVKISSGKTRWGSCSSRKNINLSLYLLLLPEHLIKYVLLHELCHTKEMNHGQSFWQLLDSVTDNAAKALAKEMKIYSISTIF